MTFVKGDLIYCEKFNEIAIFLGKSDWEGWLSVYLPQTCERKQVHDYIWELL